MSMHDDHRPGDDGVYQSVMHDREGRRRKHIVVGAVALAALLGTAAFLVTAQIVDRNDSTMTQDTNAIAPIQPPIRVTPTETNAATPAAKAVTSTKSAAKRSVSPVPSVPSSADAKSEADVKAEINAARSSAAADGVPLQRPLTAAGGLPPAQNLTQRTEMTSEGTVRVVTAKSDLTGQHELLMAADDGEPVGDVHCTQKLRFAQGSPARSFSGLLLCWRTSASRSVVTLATTKSNRRPSSAASAAIIDKEWAKLR